MLRHQARHDLAGRRAPMVAGMLLLAALVALSLASATLALAFWSDTGVGSGSGATGTLLAPTSVIVPSQAATSVAVQWSASTGSTAPDGYFVTRSNGSVVSAACGSSASSRIQSTSCTDAVGSDGSYVYTVTAVYRSWTAISSPSSAVAVAVAARLGFTGQPSNAVAGTIISPAVNVTVQSANRSSVHSAGIAVTLSIAANPASGALAGTITRSTNSLGVVTFADLSIDKVGTGYTLIAASSGLSSDTSAAFAITNPFMSGINLGSAAPYSVLGSTVANGGVSSLSGDLGAYPAASATGFPDGTVQGETHTGDTIAQQAEADLVTAYADARSRTADTNFAGDQSGATFYAGVHNTGSAFILAANGVVTLDAQGDPNAVFIFQITGALNTAAGSNILLTNGAVAANVFWASSGAAGTGANSSFSGTILTPAAATIGANGVLIGRVLAEGAVTPTSNTIRFTVALPPTIAIDGGSNATTTNRTPTISGTSNAVPGRTVSVSIAGQTLTATVLANQTWSVSAAAVAPGAYSVFVRVRDVAGNADTAKQSLSVQ